MLWLILFLLLFLILLTVSRRNEDRNFELNAIAQLEAIKRAAPESTEAQLGPSEFILLRRKSRRKKFLRAWAVIIIIFVFYSFISAIFIKS